MSSSERTKYQEVPKINSGLRIAKGNYRRFCIQGITSSLIYIGFHEVTENNGYSVINTSFGLVLTAITALSAGGALSIIPEIKELNDSKTRRDRFYHSPSRRNIDVNHQS